MWQVTKVTKTVTEKLQKVAKKMYVKYVIKYIIREMDYGNTRIKNVVIYWTMKHRILILQ